MITARNAVLQRGELQFKFQFKIYSIIQERRTRMEKNNFEGQYINLKIQSQV